MLFLIAVALSAAPASPQPIATLERTGCMGDCHAYRLEVFADGRVETISGPTRGPLRTLTAAELAALKAAFADAHYLKTKYEDCFARDASVTKLSFTDGKKTKQTNHLKDADCGSSKVLEPLAQKFDEIIGYENGDSSLKMKVLLESRDAGAGR